MFVISPHAEFPSDSVVGIAFAGCPGLVEPLFPGNVVGYKFVCKIAGGKQGEVGAFRVAVIKVERSEICLEAVFFLAVEIYFELFGIVGGAEVGFAVYGYEFIVVYSDISKKRSLPFLAHFERDICLIVEKVRVIFPFGLKGAQE